MLKNVIEKILKKSRQELWFHVVPNVHCCSFINKIEKINKTRRVIDIKDADLIVIIGPISEKMANHIETIYKAIAQKKYILKVGNCDPIFKDFSINLKSKIPVDFEINACPCQPKLLNDTLEKIREMVYFKNPVIA